MSMKFIFLMSVFMLLACTHGSTKTGSDANVFGPRQSGYLKVNGTDIYYEIYGSGQPLVLLHGGGSDIHVSFGKGLSALAKNFKVIAFDEQGHGKSPATVRPFGFVQTADDIAEALKQLKIENAMFLGFSNGATTGMYLAIRHPEAFKKMVLGSGLYSRSGAPKEFWQAMKNSTLKDMPQELKDAYLKNSPHPEDLVKMFNFDSTRMKTFTDISQKAIRKVKIPVLIMQTDQDVASVEHGIQITRLLPKGRFAVLLGPHDNFIGDVSKASPEMTAASLTLITEFLQKAE
jgi:pimeloyl-ACP methyl ester carboxylesterase